MDQETLKDKLVFALTPEGKDFSFGDETLDNLTRLARLGLWAEEHGIPLAKASYAYHVEGGGNDDWHYMHDNSAKVIAALPF